MQINALETLVMIRRVGSFSRVAQLRNMTLPAVSMQMKALEAELDVALFDRAFRPPKLTPLGERIAEDARAVVEAQAVLRSRCADTGELTGTLRLGMVPSMSVRLLPHFLHHVAQSAPQARFDLASGLSEALCEQVRNGQLDAAVVTEIADETRGLDCHQLAREEMVVLAPLDTDATEPHALAASLPFLHFMPRTGIGRLIDRYCRHMQLQSDHVIVLDNIETIVTCVRLGQGYSLLPAPDVDRYGGTEVRVLCCAPERLFRQISLVSRRDVLSRIWQPQLGALLAASAS